MSEWWQVPYPGGALVAVPGFPRELPADGLPEDGEDVEAYKRVAWRAGRWPGPAKDFDRQWSHEFVHGRAGGNVGDSGYGGLLRQGNYQGEPFLDKERFNYLRSIRIPVGLPHAGEMAMDANAANLIGLAYQRFHVKPTPPASVREQALAHAKTWLGYVEGLQNDTPFGRWYGMNYQPWCAMFVAYCYELGTKSGSPSFAAGVHYSYVPYLVADATDERNGLTLVADNKLLPGDLACFSWDWDAVFDHVGIVETGGPASFVTIEGNTSSSSSGSQSNGGGVYRRNRSNEQALVAFVRVAEP